jgi:hypothetical protein
LKAASGAQTLPDTVSFGMCVGRGQEGGPSRHRAARTAAWEQISDYRAITWDTQVHVYRARAEVNGTALVHAEGALHRRNTGKRHGDIHSLKIKGLGSMVSHGAAMVPARG